MLIIALNQNAWLLPIVAYFWLIFMKVHFYVYHKVLKTIIFERNSEICQYSLNWLIIFSISYCRVIFQRVTLYKAFKILVFKFMSFNLFRWFNQWKSFQWHLWFNFGQRATSIFLEAMIINALYGFTKFTYCQNKMKMCQWPTLFSNILTVNWKYQTH